MDKLYFTDEMLKDIEIFYKWYIDYLEEKLSEEIYLNWKDIEIKNKKVGEI